MYITTTIVALSLTAQFMPCTMMDPQTWTTSKDMATRKVGTGSKPVTCPKALLDALKCVGIQPILVTTLVSEKLLKVVPVHNMLSAI